MSVRYREVFDPLADPATHYPVIRVRVKAKRKRARKAKGKKP